MSRGPHGAERLGPPFIADAFGNELPWLGITHSHSFVREPQCNGVIERFIRVGITEIYAQKSPQEKLASVPKETGVAPRP